MISFLLLTVTVNVKAQDKYAILFSRLASVSAEEKVVARNNIKIISDGLRLQGFIPSKTIIDSRLLTRENFYKQLNEIVLKIKESDFVFLYIDLPFGIEPGTPKNELKLILDPGNPKEFVTAIELSKYMNNKLTNCCWILPVMAGYQGVP